MMRALYIPSLWFEQGAKPMLAVNNVTRFGNFLDFGQLFKAYGNNYLAQISYNLRQFL